MAFAVCVVVAQPLFPSVTSPHRWNWERALESAVLPAPANLARRDENPTLESRLFPEGSSTAKEGAVPDVAAAVPASGAAARTLEGDGPGPGFSVPVCEAPRVVRRQGSVPSHGCVVFHRMDVPPSVHHQFMGPWAISTFGCCEYAATDIRVLVVV